MYIKLNHLAIHLKHCESTILQLKKRKRYTLSKKICSHYYDLSSIPLLFPIS